MKKLYKIYYWKTWDDNKIYCQFCYRDDMLPSKNYQNEVKNITKKELEKYKKEGVEVEEVK